MIGKPTHDMNGSSSCIGLIFYSNVNLAKIVELNNHFMKHVTMGNISYVTLNFNMPLPPPYFREI